MHIPGLPEKYSWLINFSAHKILSIVESNIDISILLMNLHENNPERFQQLIGICDRLEFVEQFRHHKGLWVSEKGDRKAQYQADRLSTYLMTTCIDVATGEKFQTYEAWLKSANKSDSLNAEIWKIAMQELSEADPENIKKIFIESSSTIFKNDYQPNQSIRRAFVRFIDDLDDWFKSWLFNEYIMEYESAPLKFEEPRWTKLTSKGKSKRMGHYLYDLRNRYTHSVEYLYPMDSAQRNAGSFYELEGSYLRTVFKPSDKPQKNLVILLKSGLFESDVIKILIVAWLRKNWLGMEDNEDSIIQYWNRTRYRRLGFEFLAELEHNQSLIEKWCSYHLSGLPYHELESNDFQLQVLSDVFGKFFTEIHERMIEDDWSIHWDKSYFNTMFALF